MPKSRFVLPVLVLLPLMLIQGSGPVTAPLPDEYWWPMFHYGLTRTGYTQSTAPNTNAVLWRFKTGERIYSSPSIAAGRVFFTSGDSYIYSVNATTGELFWKTFYGGGLSFSSPAVDSWRVFWGSSAKKVLAANMYTGEILWQTSVVGNVYSSPAIAGDTVFIGSGCGPPSYIDCFLYALDAATGSEIWRYRTKGWIDSGPAINNGMVYTGGGDVLTAVEQWSGQEIWQYPTLEATLATPAISDGIVYITDVDGIIYAVNAETGEGMWTYAMDMGGLATAWSSSPAVAYGRVYVGGVSSGKLYAIDATSGTLGWFYQTENRVDNSPAVADGKVYFGSSDQNVYCLNATNGELIWKYKTGGTVFSSPSIAQGILYIGSYDTYLYAFAAPDFTISTSPEHAAVQKGQSATFNITLASTDGFSQPVTLNLTNPPPGATASFTPNPVTPLMRTPVTSTMTVQTGNLLSNAFDLEIEGTSGNLTHSARAIVEVLPLPTTTTTTTTAPPTTSTTTSTSAPTTTQPSTTTSTPTPTPPLPLFSNAPPLMIAVAISISAASVTAKRKRQPRP